MSLWCTSACNDKRDCYECGKMISNGSGSYSFDEIVLHQKKCDIFMTDKDRLIFDSLDCLEKYLRKQKPTFHNKDIFTLHVERCNFGDGKCMPYFKNDFTFASIDELLAFLPKLRQIAGFQIHREEKPTKAARHGFTNRKRI